MRPAALGVDRPRLPADLLRMGPTQELVYRQTIDATGLLVADETDLFEKGYPLRFRKDIMHV